MALETTQKQQGLHEQKASDTTLDLTRKYFLSSSLRDSLTLTLLEEDLGVSSQPLSTSLLLLWSRA